MPLYRVSSPLFPYPCAFHITRSPHEPNPKTQRLVHLPFHSRSARPAGGQFLRRYPAALCRHPHVGGTRTSCADRRLHHLMGTRLQTPAVWPQNVPGMARHPVRRRCRRAVSARPRALPRIPAQHQRPRRNQPMAIQPAGRRQQTRQTRRPRHAHPASALPEAGRLDRALPHLCRLRPSHLPAQSGRILF